MSYVEFFFFKQKTAYEIKECDWSQTCALPISQFVVVGQNDVVILKTIAQPSMDEFDQLISEARKQARKAGMKKTDITAAIQKVRKRN